MEDTPIIVLTTVATEQDADRLARMLVEARVAACVQIQSVRSVYRWKGEVCTEPECLLIIKTLDRQYPALEQFIRENHAYETPEIVELPVSTGSEAYLRWIGECVSPPAS